jgi:carbon-monoxide dehydrogenase medium subunit
VIPAAFDYVRVDTADAALAALAEFGDEAKLLAGGHSLLPLMKLRLARPSILVDVGRLDDLRYIRQEGGEVAIGALTRHHDLETSDLLGDQVPLLREAAHHVGDPQVRHRGTIGGSLAHGDPASDLPAAVLALNGSLVVEGPNGRRSIAADDFFQGFLETGVGDDEMLVEVRVPAVPGIGWSFQKFTRRAQDWAVVGVALLHGTSTSGSTHTGVGLVNMDSRPVRAHAVELALAGAMVDQAANVAAEGCEPPADLHASVEFRQHLARVLVGRAIAEAAGRTGPS